MGLCTGSASAADIIVSAAASLTNAFTDIGRQFEKANVPHKVVFNFAGSGQLVQQIARGAPVDVLACADQDTMDRAARQNLIVDASRVDFAGNSLVLIGRRNPDFALSSLQDLKSAKVRRIAISNPDTVPAGRYAREALEMAGLFAALQDKYITTQNVRQSLEYVMRGEVDAAFVYATDAASSPQKMRLLLEVPTRTPITYPIAAIKGNGKEELAARFIDFVIGPGGQAILASYGFRKK